MSKLNTVGVTKDHIEQMKVKADEFRLRSQEASDLIAVLQTLPSKELAELALPLVATLEHYLARYTSKAAGVDADVAAYAALGLG